MTLAAYSTVANKSYIFTVKEFGKLTYIGIDLHTWDVQSVGEKVINTNGRNYKSDICILTDFYKEMLAKHGDNPQWVFSEADNSKEFKAISRETLNNYKDFDTYFTRNYMYKYEDLLKALEIGEFDLVVRDMIAYNHLLYNVDNKPIMRMIPHEYRGKYYKIKSLTAHLKKHPQVKGLEVEEVESYNANFISEKKISFYFEPKDQAEFEMIYDAEKCAANGGHRENMIDKILGADAFYGFDKSD